MSLATITHACDTIEIDDYLEPFALPVVPTIVRRIGRSRSATTTAASWWAPTAAPASARATTSSSTAAATTASTPGSQFVIYRDKKQAENFLFELGEAVAVDVKPEMSTLQVTVSRDAIAAGDYVALRK